MILLGPRWRIAFGALFVAGQVALIVNGARTPDRVFAFQMFNESSTIEVHVARRVRSPSGIREMPLDKGSWTVASNAMAAKTLRWSDFVRDPVLSRLDGRVSAAYGVDAQLSRLTPALDYVASHDPDPALVSFVADVVVRRNGRAAESVRLESRTR